MKLIKTTWRSGFLFGALLLANLFLLGCGSLTYSPTADTTNTPPRRPEDISNKLQIGDLVKVEFSGTSEIIKPHEENIKGDGTITLPLIGSVKAAGRTAGELQRELQTAYERFYRNLTVTVRGSDLFYFVGGEVKSPNRQLYLGPITVIGAIKSAGDFTDFANKRKVRLIRNDGTIHFVNCKKAQENPELDLPVYPGDKIQVDRTIF